MRMIPITVVSPRSKYKIPTTYGTFIADAHSVHKMHVAIQHIVSIDTITLIAKQDFTPNNLAETVASNGNVIVYLTDGRAILVAESLAELRRLISKK